MNRWRKVMVHYNRSPGDDAGLERALDLARAHDAELTVVETVSGAVRGGPDHLDARKLHLSRFARGLRHEGIAARAIVLHGDPVTEAVREIIRGRFELLVVPRGGGNYRSFFGGDDPAARLMRESPCPVWVAPRRRPNPMKTVLAALRLGELPHERSHDIKVMRAAFDVAHREAATVALLHVWQFSEKDHEACRSGIADAQLAAFEQREVGRRELLMRRLIREAAPGNLRLSCHFQRGDAETEIQRFIAASAADVAVIGMGQRRGLFPFWRGGIAEDVLATSSCELLAVKSDEFVSAAEVDMTYDRASYSPPSAA